MADAADSGFRAWLGLEFDDERRDDLKMWLEEVLDPAFVAVADGAEMILRVTALAGRSRPALAPLAERLRGLDPPPVRVEFAAALRALPSRQRPRIYLLPARCHGLSATLAKLAAFMPPENGPIWACRAAPYVVAGRAQASLQVPGSWPPTLPMRLRGPVDAVRLGLYCSQTTPENYRLDPLAQVKLPVAAAVR